jgi:hypothetical protein
VPGDPKQCREHAKACRRLAREAISPVTRKVFDDLARTWTRLATDLEMAQALLDSRKDEELESKSRRKEPH